MMNSRSRLRGRTAGIDPGRAIAFRWRSTILWRRIARWCRSTRTPTSTTCSPIWRRPNDPPAADFKFVFRFGWAGPRRAAQAAQRHLADLQRRLFRPAILHPFADQSIERRPVDARVDGADEFRGDQIDAAPGERDPLSDHSR